MYYTIKSKDLKLSFRKDCVEEIEELNRRLEILKDKISSEKPNEEEDGVNPGWVASTEEIPIGSRVFIKFDKGLIKKGRVWSLRPNSDYDINKDGCVHTETIPRSRLKNVSVGKYQELLRDIWVLENRLIELNKIIEGANLPEVLRKDAFYIVNVVEIETYFSWNLIHFVLAENLRSGILKLPNGHIRVKGFYELKVNDNFVSQINLSSEKAFELLYNTRFLAASLSRPEY